MKIDKSVRAKLTLMRIQPFRSSGGSEILCEAELPGGDQGWFPTKAVLLGTSEINGLDTMASQLSSFWSLPLEENSCLDD